MGASWELLQYFIKASTLEPQWSRHLKDEPPKKKYLLYEQIFATKARKLVTVIGDKTNWVLVLQARSTEDTMWYVLTERWEKRSNYTRFKNIDRKQGVRRSNLTSIFQGQVEFVLIL